MQAKESWVAKWNALAAGNLVPGIYAIKVYQVSTNDAINDDVMFKGDEESGGDEESETSNKPKNLGQKRQ